MTTEEKAKAFDEALEKARKELGICGSLDCDAARQIFRFFPKLRESEDERVRKELLFHIQSEIDTYDNMISGDYDSRDKEDKKVHSMLKRAKAYLEKQKEHPTDAKLERVIKASRSVLNNWLDGTDCPDVSGDFAELEYAIREYDGEEKQKEPHYTKRNALFDKCVENCDPKTVEEVNKRVDDIMNMSELSAFEQALTNFIGYWEDDEERWPSKFVKKHSKHILDMAREELQKEQKPVSYSPLCNTIKDKIREYVANNFVTDTVVKTDVKSIVKAMEEGVRLGKEEQKPADLSETMVHKEPYIAPVPTPMVADEQFPPLEGLDAIKAKYYDDGFKNGFDEGVESVKPTEWSEEDERMLSRCVKSIESSKQFADSDTFKKAKDNEIDWLENRFKFLCPQQKVEWSEDKFPKDIEKDATQFCFDKGINITPHQAKEIATHYLMVGHNEGYVEGRKNAHIPARELGLPSSMDFKQEWSEEDEKRVKQLIYDTEAIRAGYEKRKESLGDDFNDELIKDCDEQINWLKSLRPSWKPSEVQEEPEYYQHFDPDC